MHLDTITTLDGFPLTLEQTESVIEQAQVTAAYVDQVAKHRPVVDLTGICEASRPGRLTLAFWVALVRGSCPSLESAEAA